MTDRATWTLLFVAVVAASALAVAGPAGAHGYHLSVNPQASGDGTVVVESLFAMTDGFVVLHADGGGEPGDVVGHAPVGHGYHAGVEVTADGAFWDGVTGSETLWVAVHADDGDGEFDPADDGIASFGGARAAAEVPVGKTDGGRTHVLGGVDAQEVPDPTVYVRRVALAEDGFVVLRTATGPERRVVGHAALDAGDHRLVAVPVNESFFASADGPLTLEAVVYRDDGDGAFTDADAPVTVGGRPVATTMTVEKTDGERVTPAMTPPATPPPAASTGTASATADPSWTSVPGFTVAGALAALAAAVLLRRRAR